MFIKKDIVISKQKDIVILPKNKNSIPINIINNIKKLNKFDIKHNDKSYENIKNIVLEKSKK